MTKKPKSFEHLEFDSEAGLLGEDGPLNLDPTETWQEGILAPSGNTPTLEVKRSAGLHKVFYGLIIVVFVGLLARLFVLEIMSGSSNRALADGNRIRRLVIRAPRGIIFDRNGKPLVRNVANYDLTVIPGDLPRNEPARAKIYQTLSQVSGLKADDVKGPAESKGLDYFQPVLISRNLARDKALELEVAIKQIPAFDVSINPVRDYLAASSLPHILGYVGAVSEQDLKDRKDYGLTDYIGKDGMEQEYESILRGKNGAKLVEVDALGKIVRTIGLPEEPVLGGNIVLSIDGDLAAKSIEALKAGLTRANVAKGSVTAIDPQTGEILAAASLPSYDNNLFARGIKTDQYQALLNDKNQPLFFRPFLATYPSGSTIKPYVATAGLEEKVITERTSINSTGGITLGSFNFPDWKAGGHGATDVKKALAQSVNSFFYAIGGGYEPYGIDGLGVRSIDAWLMKFGFGSVTGVDFPEEAKGLVPTPEWKKSVKAAECGAATANQCWFTGDTYHLAIGQGDLEVTPLQVAAAGSVIANGGTLYKPHLLLKQLGEDGSTARAVAPEAVKTSVASARNLDIIKAGMKECVVGFQGSCYALKDIGVAAGGKTGTAEFGPLDSKGNPKFKHAWFTAFAPFDKPRIVIVVQVEGAGEGSVYAAPIAKDILTWYFAR